MRALAFWAHEPMLAYANNYDQIRAMRFLQVHPDKPDMSEPLGGTPGQPWRYFHHEKGWGEMMYPSSDLAVKAVQLVVPNLWRPAGALVDIKQGAWLLLAVWLVAMAWVAWRLGRANAWHALGFSAWLLLVADPVNLVFLNTWYAEFPAFAALTGLVGLGWLWLAGCCRTRGAVWWGLGMLLFLATNRNQYMYLPLALLPVAWWVWRARTQAAGRPSPVLALAAVAVVVVPLLLFGAKLGQVKQANSANRVNTVLGAMLPAASDPERMLRHLRLPPSCAQFSGQTWFSTPTDAYRADCPRVLRMSLTSLVPALLADPAALGRMVMTATRNHQGFDQALLGQVQGVEQGRVAALPSLAARSVNDGLRALPTPGWQALVVVSLLLPGVMAAWALKRREHAWGQAWLALQIALAYVFFSSLLGDGYIEIERHAVLSYSLGCLLAVALVGWLVHVGAASRREAVVKEVLS
ncbi:MAG: hypothetical protein Q4G71_07675 [Pseudomonadota bacterium]|nr:hypothetical protein [Pseudomonadota bacterium]